MPYEKLYLLSTEASNTSMLRKTDAEWMFWMMEGQEN
jgi:hypothetical protein